MTTAADPFSSRHFSSNMDNQGNESPLKSRKRQRKTSSSSSPEPELVRDSSSSPESSFSSSKLSHGGVTKPRSQRYIAVPSDVKKGKRRALEFELHVPASHDTAAVASCKFAKAGCPFVGTPREVEDHQFSYCIPLYTQLAHYKMLASNATATGSSSASGPVASTSYLPDVRHSSSLQEQVSRLQSDLLRAQKALEEEKRLRTERLRKASERCLELMSISELGEGKVEVLRAQLHAERELREKLEEELDALHEEFHLDDSRKHARLRKKRSRSNIPATPASSEKMSFASSRHHRLSSGHASSPAKGMYKRERTVSEDVEVEKQERTRW